MPKCDKCNFETEKNGGLTNIDNLRPVCSTCNKSMGTKNMVDFSITLM